MDMNEKRTLDMVLRVGAALILVLPLLGATAGRMETEQTPTDLSEAIPRSDGVASDQVVDLRLPFGRVEGEPVAAARPEAGAVRFDGAYGQTPLSFEANRGQTDGRVKFLARSRGQTLFLTPTEAVLVLTKIDARVSRDKFRFRKAERARRDKVIRTAVRMKLVGANRHPQLSGLEEQPGKVNYFIGNDPAKWRTNVPTYARVEYRDVYPGVNLIYYGNQRQLEYDFVVAAGADPGVIRLGFEGADKLALDGQGNLVLQAAVGQIIQRPPIVYQNIGGGRREIAARYVLRGKTRVGFQVAAYDRTQPLVIDPVLIYSTYLGGSGDDFGYRIAVDAAGNAYVTGGTDSTNFPTTVGAFQPALNGPSDAFVTKLNPTGSGVVYSTYIGGSGGDDGDGVAVDASGNVYVTGRTDSTDFPTTPGAFQTVFAGGIGDKFVAKLNPTGSGLIYSTYLGGSGWDGIGLGNIAVDAAGNAYVVGITESTDFPTTPGAFQTAFGGSDDAFVTKLNPTGSGLVYSTYLGGSGHEFGAGIAVDAAGNAYVMGQTDSTNFPTTPGAFQTAFAGGSFDAFVTKLNPLGSGLVYSTHIGGSGDEQARGIALDAAGSAYVVGFTDSTDFPTTPGAFQTTLGGVSDVFVTKLNSTGSALAYSTYLGGSDFDFGLAIAVDVAGNAYVTGGTDSTNFPTTPNAFQTTSGSSGIDDVFITKLNPTGSGLVYSTYLGGSGEGDGIALDGLPNPNAYVVGQTGSTDFPTVNPFQPAFGNGGSDAFVAKIGDVAANTPVGSNVVVQPIDVSTTLTFAQVTQAGVSSLIRRNDGTAPPTGFSLGTPPTYYEIKTTAVFTATVAVCITYSPTEFADPTMLHLLHLESNVWVDVTTINDTGTHVICGQVSSFSPFVIAKAAGSPLSSLGPANAWVGLKNSDDVGIRFDLRAEVYRNGTQLVGSGEAVSVAGGSSGFNNARLDAITLTPVAGATFGSGETLSIKLLVRNACTGSGKNSGTARLWFNDSAANSRFDATLGSPHTYFLADGFALASSPGPGPKKTIDVAAGAKCGAFKPFGTWSIALP